MTKLLNAHPCPHCGQALFIMNNPFPPKLKELRWVHRRGAKGDVETHASTKEQAITIFRHYGFPQADDSNVAPGRSKAPVPASDL